jgi:hypothetical protein
MYFSFCREFSLIGLALIAVGTGGIKPCVASFGGKKSGLPCCLTPWLSCGLAAWVVLLPESMFFVAVWLAGFL